MNIQLTEKVLRPKKNLNLSVKGHRPKIKPNIHFTNLNYTLSVKMALGQRTLEEGCSSLLVPGHLVGHVESKHVAHLHHSNHRIF